MGTEHCRQASAFRRFYHEGKEPPAFSLHPDTIEKYRFPHTSEAHDENAFRCIAYPYAFKSNTDTFPDIIPSRKIRGRAACPGGKKVCDWIHSSSIVKLVNFANFPNIAIDPLL